MIEKQPNRQDFKPIGPSFYYLEVRRLLDNYGVCQSYESFSGDTITVFPTCIVPIEYLETHDWKKITEMGNFRCVYSVDALSNGINPHIVVKSPERIFTKDNTLLSRGYPWWGGSRSTQKRTIQIEGNPIVEEQTLWEAIILLELYRQGIKAELPQAFIERPNGEKELVVNEIQVAWGFFRSGNQDDIRLTTDNFRSRLIQTITEAEERR